MILRYFYDDRLAQASYMVGCAKTGEALVIDPARAITPYLKAAEKEGLRITHVAETHIHADFVSGSRELAAATGATIYLSDMGDADWKYAYADEPNVILVRDGDAWMVGNIRIEVIHTPGHTPEHIAFQLTDTAGSSRPMGIFTGDFVFVGDVGRPTCWKRPRALPAPRKRARATSSAAWSASSCCPITCRFGRATAQAAPAARRSAQCPPPRWATRSWPILPSSLPQIRKMPLSSGCSTASPSRPATLRK